jgi:hypothetical protein
MQTLGDFIERNDRCYPDSTVFVSGARSLTYDQYAQRSRRHQAGQALVRHSSISPWKYQNWHDQQSVG